MNLEERNEIQVRKNIINTIKKNYIFATHSKYVSDLKQVFLYKYIYLNTYQFLKSFSKVI